MAIDPSRSLPIGSASKLTPLGGLAAALLLGGVLVFGGFPASWIFQRGAGTAPLPWSVIAFCAAIGIAVVIACRTGAAPLLASASVLARVAQRGGFPLALAVGIGLRLATAWIVAPTPASDGATYLALAAQLLDGRGYGTAGTLAYWPPGLPLALVPFLALFGQTSTALVAFGLVTFVVAAVGTLLLARRVGLGANAVVAVWLFALWPSNIFSTGLPEKELLVIALMPWALLLGSLALPVGAAARWALAAGAAVGLMVLVQPSLQLLPLAAAIVALFGSVPRWRLVKLFVLSIAGLLIVVAPWSVRSSIALAAPVLVSTNGGSNLYRANNDWASGVYLKRGPIDVEALDELAADREGKRLAVDWIIHHPLAFARLSVTKALLFAGDDSYGAYAAYRANRERIPSAAYLALKGISAVPWLLMWALLVASTRRSIEAANGTLSGAVAILLLPYAYLSTLHTVFESGGKYHLPAILPLIVLTTLLLEQRAGIGAVGSTYRSLPLPQWLRFACVGLVNTAIGLGVIYGLKYFLEWNDVAANIVGYACGLTVSFVLNRRWTFEHSGKWKSALIRFLGVFIVAYGVNLWLLLALRNDWGWSSYLAQFAAMVAYTIVFFTGSRHFAFRAAPRIRHIT